MSERPAEYFEQFKGYKFPVSKYRIKGKKLSAFAAAIGDKNPKYYVPDPEDPNEKADYSGIVAHPAYAACYTIPKLLESLPDIKGSDGEPMLRNIGKLLHAAQEYDFSGCDPLTPATKKVFSEAEFGKFWIKSNILWGEAIVVSTNEDKSKTFCKTIIRVGIRKGGY